MEDGSWWPSLQTAVGAWWKTPSLTRKASSFNSGEESLRVAEQQADEILQRVRPTEESEERRRAITKYMQNFLEREFGCKVLPVGSVPLKTYLPDGDIDLTALTDQNPDDVFATDVFNALEREEHNKDAEFKVKHVQHINAEVKLIKCVVQDIVVDISINQKGGLMALCFFELVDQFIGKAHLFKRSIIFIKAWCYYESRILGAHHGLVSTYALNMMILYIFNLFHKSLSDPLMVLYKFLDYFSKFDWDNYGISLHGPISLKSLPQIVVGRAEADECNLLLSKEFLKSCLDMFSQISRGTDSRYSSFPMKYLNMIDPLKENNNLGRSVGKGNLYRIRSALAHGAQKVGDTLKLPPGLVVDDLNMFFKNTLNWHGSGERQFVQEAFTFASVDSALDCNCTCSVSLVSEKERNKPADMNSGRPLSGFRVLFTKSTNNNTCQCKGVHWWKRKESTRAVSENLKDSLPKSERGQSLTTKSGANETSISTFPGLGGDPELHLRSLHQAYGIEFKSGQFDKLFHMLQLRQIVPTTQTNTYTRELSSSSSASTSHITEERPQSWRKSTYSFMKGNHSSSEQPLILKEKKLVPLIQLPTADSDGSTLRSSVVKLPEQASLEPSSKMQLNSQLSYPISKGQSQAKRQVSQQQGRPDHGSFAPLPLYAYSPELCKKFNITTDSAQTSAFAMSNSRKSLIPRRGQKPFQLNDIDDFPPLSL